MQHEVGQNKEGGTTTRGMADDLLSSPPIPSLWSSRKKKGRIEGSSEGKRSEGERKMRGILGFIFMSFDFFIKEQLLFI